MSSVPEGNMLPLAEQSSETEVQVQRVARASGLTSVTNGMVSVTFLQTEDLLDAPVKVKVNKYSK